MFSECKKKAFFLTQKTGIGKSDNFAVLGIHPGENMGVIFQQEI